MDSAPLSTVDDAPVGGPIEETSPASSGTPRAALEARALELLGRPLLDLVYEAAGVHREHHDPSRIQCAQLLSIKTGACPEDCGYCSQSARHSTGLEREALMETNEVVAAAQRAKDAGADRFCMGAAWREVRCGKDFDRVLDMVRGVKDLGLEVCATLGMVDEANGARLADAGLDYYNHNLDTSREHYEKVIGTRTYDDRLETLENVRSAGMKVCSGGILGMGETRADRARTRGGGADARRRRRTDRIGFGFLRRIGVVGPARR